MDEDDESWIPRKQGKGLSISGSKRKIKIINDDDEECSLSSDTSAHAEKVKVGRAAGHVSRTEMTSFIDDDVVGESKKDKQKRKLAENSCDIYTTSFMQVNNLLYNSRRLVII